MCTDDGLLVLLRTCVSDTVQETREMGHLFSNKSKRKYVVRRHASSSMHQLALGMNMHVWHQTVMQAFSNSLAAQRRAAIGARKCLYWLAKNDIPHTTKYVSLIQLASNLGCTYFDSLHRGGNATYSSKRIIQEFLHDKLRPPS